MKRIEPGEIDFFKSCFYEVHDALPDHIWSETIDDMLVDSEILNFDMRIRAMIVPYGKIMYRL